MSTSSTVEQVICSTGLFDANLQCLDNRLPSYERSSFQYYTTWSALFLMVGAVCTIFNVLLRYSSKFAKLRRTLVILALASAANSFAVFVTVCEIMAYGENVVCSETLGIIMSSYAIKDTMQTHLMMHVAPMIVAILIVIVLLATPYRIQTSTARTVLSGSLIVALFMFLWMSIPVANSVCNSDPDAPTTQSVERVRFSKKASALYGRIELSTAAVFSVSCVSILAAFAVSYKLTIPRA